MIALNSPTQQFTIGGAARALGVPPWQVRRLFERGLLAEPGRVGSYRVLGAADLPVIKAALENAGYLNGSEVVGSGPDAREATPSNLEG